ncbi:MSC_0882 family membrane protein [Mycoplasmopsis iners]|uniref:MSC_0882 family membrane protein n=1 Tax=Mycoplasmopsis iners TaxID=76630 RepID=UPI000497FCD8|nr:hypothetical protein [Mycoplasmopsis iners]
MSSQKYKPIEDSQTVELIRNGQDFNYANENTKVVRDPKNQISPRIYKAIRTEWRIKIIMMSIWFTIMLTSMILFILAYTKQGVFKERYVGYLVIFATLGFIGLVLGIKNLVDKMKWTKAIQTYRNSLINGDYSTNNTFYLAYRRLSLKGVNLTWLLVFIITYLGLFTLIVYGLYASNEWKLGNEETLVRINIKWRQILDKTFGNTILLCILCGSTLAIIVASYIFIMLFDKKRLNDIYDFLDEKAIEIHDKIAQAKKERNKMWMKIYIFAVMLTILLPVLALLFTFWKKVIRRKKA